jgi:hypothetical protein
MKKTFLKQTWANEETGQLVIGTNEDDVIEIGGVLKSGKARTKFTLVITHDGVTPSMDFQMIPNVDKFQQLFRGAAFNGRNIELNYNVGNIADILQIKALIINHKL